MSATWFTGMTPMQRDTLVSASARAGWGQSHFHRSSLKSLIKLGFIYLDKNDGVRLTKTGRIVLTLLKQAGFVAQ
jgi:hypothetical protein